MSDDLVKRLRDWPPHLAGNITTEAADEITLLQALSANVLGVMKKALADNAISDEWAWIFSDTVEMLEEGEPNPVVDRHQYDSLQDELRNLSEANDWAEKNAGISSDGCLWRFWAGKSQGLAETNSRLKDETRELSLELLAAHTQATEAVDELDAANERINQLRKDRNDLIVAGERDSQELSATKDKLAAYEAKDGMDGAVVDMIRQVLTANNVPKAAFIDDHVMNAIVERNQAKDKLAKAVAFIEEHCDLFQLTDDEKKPLAEIKGE